ncbi:MAG: acyl CoA:acetate/3-ketoacid CoA transferase [Pseudomonadota bacterium]
MRNKVVSVQEAIALIRDNDTICNSGFVGCGVPEYLLSGLAQRYQEAGHPRDLTLIFAAGQGDGKDQGLNKIAFSGLIKRVIGGHWGLIPQMGKLATSNLIEAYNLQQGCISQLYRDIAAGKPGTLTKVGIGTFVDPRIEGGKINDRTTEDIVELVEMHGEEWLFYQANQIDVALIRATTADIAGNLSMEHEALTLDTLAMAMAARNAGGLVIAQVERVAELGSLPSRQVKIPGIFVDCVVVAPQEQHQQTYATAYSAAFSGEYRAPVDHVERLPLDVRKVIARRAAFELPVNGVVNLGIGMPEGVAQVAAEEGVLKAVTLTAEPGVIGGLPASGLDFGAATNADAIIDQNQQFDFYDGGGLDLACLGLAQCDSTGNINVSRFGPKLAGAGGFINISQNAKKVVFMGTFTADGLSVSINDGKLRIDKEGRTKKFVEQVEQITFSGEYALKNGKTPLYVTERCVFRLEPRGFVLVEVAAGICIENDILKHMAFTPIIDAPKPMSPCIFDDAKMDLKAILVAPSIEQRIHWDANRELLFIDFENYTVRDKSDVEAIRLCIEHEVAKLNRPVNVIVNYDGCVIDEEVVNDYVAMVKYLEKTHYDIVLRYSSSVFTRVKLGLRFIEKGKVPTLFKG